MPDRSELNVDCGRLEGSRWASARWSSTAAPGEEAAGGRHDLFVEGPPLNRRGSVESGGTVIDKVMTHSRVYILERLKRTI